jgi:hypothetical protein
VPAAVNENRPLWVFGDLREQPEDLRVSGGTVAPTGAVPLDQVRTVGWVAVGHEETVGSGLVAADDVGRSCERKLDEIVSPGSVSDRGQCADDAQRAVREVV